MQTVRNFNHKSVTAILKTDLLTKIAESQLRGWFVKGELKQLSNGHWSCLMIRNKK